MAIGEELLKKVDYVQLHINEARGFFSELIESAKLPILMEFLSTLEAIFCITLDDFGAICLTVKAGTVATLYSHRNTLAMKA